MTNLPDAHYPPRSCRTRHGAALHLRHLPGGLGAGGPSAERDKNVTPFFGIHPWRVNPAAWKEEMRLLESFLKKFPRAGIGETGLDNAAAAFRLPLQREALKQHLELAARLNRPTALHCCRAWGTLAGMLCRISSAEPCCTAGWVPWNPGAQLPSGNWLLSVGPREMDRPGLLSSIPLHRLALESDEHPEALPELTGTPRKPFHERGRTGRPGCGQYGESLPLTAAGRRNALPERGWQETAAFFLAGSCRRLSCGHGPFSGSNQFSVGNQAAAAPRHGSLAQDEIGLGPVALAMIAMGWSPAMKRAGKKKASPFTTSSSPAARRTRGANARCNWPPSSASARGTDGGPSCPSP